MGGPGDAALEDLEANGVVNGAPKFVSTYELSSLRNELLLRIALQNVLLILTTGLFCGIAAVCLVAPFHAWLFAVTLNCAVLALALQWCHHGIRTAQIKRYLVLADTEPSGWEHWLPVNRPSRLLGTRWIISTEGVFLGLGGAIVCLAAWLDPSPGWVLPLGSSVLWCATEGFLFTNPKEQA